MAHDFEHTERIAVNYNQLKEYGLPKLPGKLSDPRAPAFIKKYGELFQVELEALEPEILRGLY